MSEQQVTYKKFVDRAQDWILGLIKELYATEESVPKWVIYKLFVESVQDELLQKLVKTLTSSSPDDYYLCLREIYFPFSHSDSELASIDDIGEFLSLNSAEIPDDVIEAWNLYQNSE